MNRWIAILLVACMALAAGCAAPIIVFEPIAPLEPAATQPEPPQAPETPAPIATPPRATAETAIEQDLEAIRAYEYGMSREPMERITAYICSTHEDASAQREIAARLAETLLTECTLACREYICQRLAAIGTKREVGALALFLGNDQMGEKARYALERIPGPEATGALREALFRCQGPQQIGIVNSLGVRRDGKSIGALEMLLDSGDPALADAAATALGRIGGSHAVRVLMDRREMASAPLREALDTACLESAELYLKEGPKRRATAIYEALYDPSNSHAIRLCALAGLTRTGGKRGLQAIADALGQSDPDFFQAGLEGAEKFEGKAATQLLIDMLALSTAERRVAALDALAARGDRAALDAVRSEARSSHGEVRTAALRALGALGDASTADLLIQTASASEGIERDAARASLGKLEGEQVATILLATYAQGQTAQSPNLRQEAIRSLGQRNERAAIATILEAAANDAYPEVRKEALGALAIVGEEKHLPELARLMVKAQWASEREEAQNAYLAVARRLPEGQPRATPLNSAFQSAKDAQARLAIVHTLRLLQDADSLNVLDQATQDKSDAVRDEAVRTLALSWPHPEALAILRRIAEGSKDETHRILALRGFARLLALPSDRSADETADLYAQGLKLATTQEEKQSLLDGLGKVRSEKALALAEAHEKDSLAGETASRAADRIYYTLHAPMAASASENKKAAGNAIDGDPATRWDSGGAQRPGQWFSVDLGTARSVDRVSIDAGASANDYPRQYVLYVTTDPEDWGKPVAQGKGTQACLDIKFPALQGRYVMILQSGFADGNHWAIHELRVNSRPASR